MTNHNIIGKPDTEFIFEESHYTTDELSEHNLYITAFYPDYKKSKTFEEQRLAELSPYVKTEIATLLKKYVPSMTFYDQVPIITVDGKILNVQRCGEPLKPCPIELEVLLVFKSMRNHLHDYFKSLFVSDNVLKAIEQWGNIENVPTGTNGFFEINTTKEYTQKAIDKFLKYYLDSNFKYWNAELDNSIKETYPFALSLKDLIK